MKSMLPVRPTNIIQGQTIVYNIFSLGRYRKGDKFVVFRKSIIVSHVEIMMEIQDMPHVSHRNIKKYQGESFNTPTVRFCEVLHFNLTCLSFWIFGEESNFEVTCYNFTCLILKHNMCSLSVNKLIWLGVLRL